MMRVFLKDDIDYQALKARNLENVESLFETEESVPDIFKYNDSYYTFCVINRAENWMIVEKFNLYDLNDVDYTDEITCPYCNSSQSDSWEAPDEGDYECERYDYAIESDERYIEKLRKQIVEYDQSTLNENQQVVLEWLKWSVKEQGNSPMDAIYLLVLGETLDSVSLAYIALTPEQQTQVLTVFSKEVAE